MALFGGDNGFTERISESFGKFGIKMERWEKGGVKNALRLDMFDTIHDSKYIAVAVKSSHGKNAPALWNDIIEKDLIPAAAASGEEPAAALIIPSKDADTVIEMCRKRYLTPTVYQLFPGYVVAGFQKRDMAKLLSEHEKSADNSGQEKPADKAEKDADSPEKGGAEEVLGGQAGKKPGKTAGSSGQKQSETQAAPKTTSPLGKKLAAAALLGVTLGLMPLGAKTVMDKLSSNKEQEEEAAADRAAVEKYFNGIKNGTPENMELLKYIASNPQLAREELERLADTPVGTEAAKNPAAPENIIEKAALSANEDKRAAAAENPAAPEALLRRLSADPSPKVRSAAARNPAIPRDVMQKLAKDEPEVRESLLENNMLPPDILDTITSGASASCDFNRKLMANPCIDPAALAYNADNPDSCIREGVAANPNTPPEVLAGLTDDPLPKVREAAWKNAKIPRDKISSIFMPRWTPDEKNIKLEEARKAALENPAADKGAMRKAVFIDPEKYAGHVAKNPSAPASLINRLKSLSDGSGGLRKFISDAMDMKNDPETIEKIKNLAAGYGGDPSVPLRKTLNAGFAKNVYDPYRLIQDMRRFPNPDGMKDGPVKFTPENASGKYTGIPQAEGLAVRKYSMDDFGNIPERFSDLPMPERRPDDQFQPEAEKAAFEAADAIVDGIMENVLPAFMPGKDGTAAKNSKKSSGSPSGAQAETAGGIGASSGGGSYGGNPAHIPEGSPEWLFQNACERIDVLQSMF